jgi:hypothetical protein
MKSKDNFTYLLIYLLITLMALLVSNVYFSAQAQQERQAQAERIEERQVIYEEYVGQMQAALARQQRVVDGVADSYHADAYNSDIDRIAEQQLIAAEYQMLLLQVIAQQNAQMIELLTMMRP